MRTTVRLCDRVLADAKKYAAETGRTLTSVLEDALREACPALHAREKKDRPPQDRKRRWRATGSRLGRYGSTARPDGILRWSSPMSTCLSTHIGRILPTTPPSGRGSRAWSMAPARMRFPI